MAAMIARAVLDKNLSSFSQPELLELARELRDEMISATSENGGHLASSLGAVEIIIAAHCALDLDTDKLLFDVGHQAYAHKLLTGRSLKGLRTSSGVSGFTRREESPFDVHNAGHASDALPTAVGLALARDIDGSDAAIVSVIGDASIAGGLSYEALNYAGQQQFKRFVVILNDNEMSISPSVGAFATYLTTIRTSPAYMQARDSLEGSLAKVGKVGSALVRLGERAKEATKQFLVPGMFFEDIGYTYLGPIDGHDIAQLTETISRALTIGKPVVIHAVTKKGKGYEPAEKNPELFHGITPFDPQSGIPIQNAHKNPAYTRIFADQLIAEAEVDPSIVAITAAMPAGTGLDAFARKFPDRFFDVGIAEECAVTMASGLAIGHKTPVVAIYSTFLQRAFDEISTNVCMQNLHVVFALDRAGLVGEDGATHHGAFDMAYLRALPNMQIIAPSDEVELVRALHAALAAEGPVALRFPRGSAFGLTLPETVDTLPHEARIRYASSDREAFSVGFLCVGRLVSSCVEAAKTLDAEGTSCIVYDMRWVKPIDVSTVDSAANSCDLLVLVEEGTTTGGFGSAVLETLSQLNLSRVTLQIGLPDSYVGHGSVSQLLASLGLDPDGIAGQVRLHLARLKSSDSSASS